MTYPSRANSLSAISSFAHVSVNPIMSGSSLSTYTVYHRVQVDSRISRRVILGEKFVQNRRFKYKSNQKFGKNKTPKRREIPSQRSLYSRKFGPAIYNFA